VPPADDWVADVHPVSPTRMVVTMKNQVAALEIELGTIAWKVHPTELQGSLASPWITTAQIPGTDDLLVSGNGVILRFAVADGTYSLVARLGGKASPVTFEPHAVIASENCERVYVSSAGYVRCYEPGAANELKWDTNLKLQGFGQMTIAETKDYVVAAGNGYLNLLDKESGKLQAKFNFKGTGYEVVTISVSQDQQSVYACVLGMLWCLELPTLQTIWFADFPKQGLYRCATMVVGGEFIYLAFGHRVRAVRANTGEQVWLGELDTGKLSKGFLSDTTMVQLDDMVIVAAPRRIGGFCVRTGERLWTQEREGISPLSIASAKSWLNHNTSSTPVQTANAYRNSQ
jgi:outer membrane protein assembly factor BamB